MSKEYIIFDKKDKENLNKDLDKMINLKIPCKAKMTRLQKVKTLPQVKYIWGIIYEDILNHLYQNQGYGKADIDKEKLHKILKNKFFYNEIMDFSTGKIIKENKSLAKASIVETMQFINEIILWAKEMLSLHILSPEDYQY